MRRLSLVVALVALVGAAGLTACGEPEDASPAPTSTPTDAALSNPSLKAFLSECKQSVDVTRPGMVFYPESVNARLNQGLTYQVVMDVRADTSVVTPPSTKKLTISGVPVNVRCVIGAQLESTSEDVKVVGESNAPNGWLYQQLTMTGQLRWHWTVTGKTIGDYELALNMRPVVALSNEYIGPDADTSTFVSEVSVGGTRLERFKHWLTTEGGVLSVIAAILLSALLWTLSQVSIVRKAFRRAFPKRRNVTRRPTVKPDLDAQNSGDGTRPRSATDSSSAGSTTGK